MDRTRQTINVFIGCCNRLLGRLDFVVKQPQPKHKAMLELTINNEQKVRVLIAPVDSAGKPAKLDGAPTWETSSGDSTVVPDPDGLGAFLVSSDTPGESIINVTADADLGAGVETIADAIKLTAEGAKAASLGLTAGTPELK